MVVVPTETDVELTYGRSPIELISLGLTLTGVAGAVVLARRPEEELDGAWWDLGRAHQPVEASSVVDSTVSWERIVPGGLSYLGSETSDDPERISPRRR